MSAMHWSWATSRIGSVHCNWGSAALPGPYRLSETHLVGHDAAADTTALMSLHTLLQLAVQTYP